MKNKIINMLCYAILVTSCSVPVYAASKPTDTVNPDDVVITIAEEESDGHINYVTYDLKDLSYAVYDENDNVVYSGPVLTQNPITKGYNLEEATVSSESKVMWYPTNNESGFKCGNGIAVTVSIKTNSTASKTIGLTSGGSSTSTNKNPSAILYTGTDGYWKFYVQNHSSSSFKVTGGSLSWGE